MLIWHIKKLKEATRQIFSMSEYELEVNLYPEKWITVFFFPCLIKNLKEVVKEKERTKFIFLQEDIVDMNYPLFHFCLFFFLSLLSISVSLSFLPTVNPLPFPFIYFHFPFFSLSFPIFPLSNHIHSRLTCTQRQWKSSLPEDFGCILTHNYISCPSSTKYLSRKPW